jgi:hypothetical protein
LDVNSLCNIEGIIDLDAVVAHGALDVGIGYQEAATKKTHEDALSFLKEIFK